MLPMGPLGVKCLNDIQMKDTNCWNIDPMVYVLHILVQTYILGLKYSLVDVILYNF